MNDCGLYIHIPFCNGKCYYCDFFSRRANDKLLDEYTELLIQKIKLCRQRINDTFTSVYLGGGTPSILKTKRLCDILKAVNENINLSNPEITLEVNPDDSDLDFSLLKKLGVNRVSVGLQTADEYLLSLIGRRHSVNDVFETINNIKSAGIKNISLDLMLGLPQQTYETLDKTFEFIKQCNVNHISCYILKLEENTVLYKNRKKYNLCSDDMQADFYFYAIKKLEELGFRQYEISNFSKPNFESRHNLKYWNLTDYIGLGPSAHSFYHGKRFHFERSFNDFYQDIITDDGNGGDAEEYIMLQLRLVSGLNLNILKEKYGTDLLRAAENKIKLFENSGFIKLHENVLSLTEKGFAVSNSIIAELFEFLD